MTTCTVNKCYEEKEHGDNIFCKNDRIEWKKVCNANFGINEQSPEKYINKLLNKFIQRFK